MADAKPVNPSGLSPQQQLDWQKIIENAPPGGYFDPASAQVLELSLVICMLRAEGSLSLLLQWPTQFCWPR